VLVVVDEDDARTAAITVQGLPGEERVGLPPSLLAMASAPARVVPTVATPRATAMCVRCHVVLTTFTPERIRILCGDCQSESTKSDSPINS
jgi:hypothetical protein